MAKTTCQQCGQEFDVRPAALRRGQGIYCSRACFGIANRKPRLTDADRIARFWARVRIGSAVECWEWSGHTNRSYGHPRWYGRKEYAHRIAWMLTYGDPGSLDVLHRCDNPPCCNPAHLFLGTQADNNRDMTNKGRNRGLRGERHPAAKLTASQVAAIRATYATGTTTQEALGARYGVGQYAISRIVRGKGWQDVPSIVPTDDASLVRTNGTTGHGDGYAVEFESQFDDRLFERDDH